MKFIVRTAAMAAITVACAMFLPAQAPVKKETTQAKSESVATSADDKSSIKDLDFPVVDGWKRGDRVTLPEPGAGYVHNYDSPTSGRVTIYVYDRGLKKIPNELTGEVKDEMDGAVEAIRFLASNGIYSDVKESKIETVTLGGEKGKVRSLRVGLQLTINERKQNSAIYIFPYRDHFVKLRATGKLDGDPQFASLLAAIDQLFSKQ